MLSTTYPTPSQQRRGKREGWKGGGETDNDAALPDEPLGLLEIGHVVLRVRVDEDEVEELGGGGGSEGREGVDGGPDEDFDFVGHAGGF